MEDPADRGKRAATTGRGALVGAANTESDPAGYKIFVGLGRGRFERRSPWDHSPVIK